MGQVNVNPPAQPASDGSGAGFILGIIVAIVIIALLIYFLFLNGGGGTPANNSIAPGPSALLLRFLG
ncbi:MAG TPA: hypothetical protein VFK93_01655 [Candidatus Limnocylindria bacterium]|jgi:hypothetical protein|nr:hypothetical protein [Candidatus Limnocylindria bacterium]